MGLRHEFRHLRIEFHGIDPARTVIQRKQHVVAGAGAENQHGRFLEQAER